MVTSNEYSGDDGSQVQSASSQKSVAHTRLLGHPVGQFITINWRTVEIPSVQRKQRNIIFFPSSKCESKIWNLFITFNLIIIYLDIIQLFCNFLDKVYNFIDQRIGISISCYLSTEASQGAGAHSSTQRIASPVEGMENLRTAPLQRQLCNKNTTYPTNQKIKINNFIKI